jgi:hypothetical protein
LILFAVYPSSIAKSDTWSYGERQTFIMTCAANAFKSPELKDAYTPQQASEVCACVLDTWLSKYTGQELRDKFDNYGPIESQEAYNFTYNCATWILSNPKGTTTYL